MAASVLSSFSFYMKYFNFIMIIKYLFFFKYNKIEIIGENGSHSLICRWAPCMFQETYTDRKYFDVLKFKKKLLKPYHANKFQKSNSSWDIFLMCTMYGIQALEGY